MDKITGRAPSYAVQYAARQLGDALKFWWFCDVIYCSVQKSDPYRQRAVPLSTKGTCFPLTPPFPPFEFKFYVRLFYGKIRLFFVLSLRVEPVEQIV